MAMANNLTGDATKDGPMLQKLQSGFEGAIQKNMGLQSLVRTSLYRSHPLTNLITGYWWF